MKFLVFFAFVVGILCVHDDRHDRIDALWAPFKNTAGVSFGIIQNGAFLYNKQFGFADLVTKTPITKDTKFLIGSTSKQFTAMAIALLEEKGLLKVTDNINKFVPELSNLGNITLLHLIQHVSGHRDYMNLALFGGIGLPHFALERSEAFDIVKRQETLGFPTNSKWDYSNTGYLLMEYVIERVSGVSFEEFLKKHIFGPLNMKDTHVSADRSIVIENAASGYLPSPTGPRFSPLISNMIAGAGGIQTTMGDFLKFDQNFYNNQLGGGNALIEKLITPGRLSNGQSHGYAYGLMIQNLGNEVIVAHDGAFPGYLTSMIRFPKRNTTFIMMSNTYDMTVYERAKNAIKIWFNLDVNVKFLDRPMDLKLDTNPKSFKAEKYLGWYHSRELNKAYHIVLVNNVMGLTIRGIGFIPLILKGNGHAFWIGAVGGPSGTFYESRSGVIIGMEFINLSRAAHLRLSKLDKEPICTV